MAPCDVYIFTRREGRCLGVGDCRGFYFTTFSAVISKYYSIEGGPCDSDQQWSLHGPPSFILPIHVNILLIMLICINHFCYPINLYFVAEIKQFSIQFHTIFISASTTSIMLPEWKATYIHNRIERPIARLFNIFAKKNITTL